MVDEGDGDLAGLDADLLLAVLIDHVVLAVRPCPARLAVANVRAREVLQLEGDVLGDVPRPRSLAKTGDEPAAAAERAGVLFEGWQQLDESVAEAGDQVRRVVLERPEVDEHPDDGLAGPVVGAAEDAGLDDPQIGPRAGVRLYPVAGRDASVEP